MSYRVKPEPAESSIPPARPSTNHGGPSYLKSEPNDAVLNGYVSSAHLAAQLQQLRDLPEEQKPAEEEPLVPEPMARFFKTFTDGSQIDYQPEEALKEGLAMVKSLKASINKLELGSKRREEVWERDLQDLESQGAPTTLIAVCGATGAGKSSILNAILDNDIVPTSGMRACTAVVTEISYHKKSTVDAEISFLSEQDWRQELEVLLHDLVDEEGKLKRVTDQNTDAGVAWQKVHAVYPTISQDALIKMTADEIMKFDQKISGILGTTKSISAPNPKEFAKEIAKYIDSKDARKHKDKKSKSKKLSVMDKVRKTAGLPLRDTGANDRENDIAPALWPLITQVKVKCKAAALSTGAVLVDLPGVADANAARNNIAKTYMKKCNCVWVLAPITRAVDDKTARDLLGAAFKDQLMNGNYDDNSITFIASKCDDISCSEIIHALELQNDEELEAIEERLSDIQTEVSECKKKKKAAEKVNKEIQASLKAVMGEMKENKKHLEALKNGDRYVPPVKKPTKKQLAKGKKRKNSFGGRNSPKKRSRTNESEAEDSFIDDDNSDGDFDDDAGDESDVSAVVVVSDHEEGSGSESENEDELNNSDQDEDIRSDQDGDEDDEEDVEMEEVITQDSLKAKIEDGKNMVKALKNDLKKSQRDRKHAMDTISRLTKDEAKVQREKNAFCSLKRSEFSRDQLKSDFRTGLKEMDDAVAEKRDPDNFDPSKELRDYEAVNLPVFTCSSRDYIRIKGQVKGDGEPTCFSNVDDTGIPELQRWCHQLTTTSRERSARNFLSHIKAFALSIKSYVNGIGDVTAGDRQMLRDKFESHNPNEDDDGMGAIIRELENEYGGGFPATDQKPKLDVEGRIAGITPRLRTEFMSIIEGCVKDLQRNFKDGLEEKCQIGAVNAAKASMSLYSEFSNSMHWMTFRATLRRHGTWRRDLNVELLSPFTRNIASTWGKVFESDLFSDFETMTIGAIENIIKDVEDTSPEGLKERTRTQGKLCMEEARLSLVKSVDLVRETMNNEQKEISRCMAPHVQDQLVTGYDMAAEERGRGSVARQKDVFSDYLSECKDEIFEDGATIILDALMNAAKKIGEALDKAMTNLAQKIEVNLSVLWESTHDNPAQQRIRLGVVDVVGDVIKQLDLWNQARQDRPV